MPTPNNIFQQVQTYQNSELAFLLNQSPYMNLANTRFKDFQTMVANLGSSVNYDLPPRRRTVNSLIAQFGPWVQRVRTLTVDKPISCSAAVNIEQLIFNDVDGYMAQFGRSGMIEIGSQVEADLATINTKFPYRAFGDGNTNISSFGQLAQALALYRSYGAVKDRLKVVLPSTVITQIVNSGFGQFTPARNDEMAQSWMIGSFDNADFYASNLVPKHTAGHAGLDGDTLAVVSTDDPTGANITQITFSTTGASSEVGSIKQNDIITFTNQYFLTFSGHIATGQNKVQVRALADADTTGGNITVDIYPPLVSAPTNDQNLENNLAAGMTATVANSRLCGLILGGDAFFLGMPRMPEEVPFPTARTTDPDTGVSICSYYGSKFGMNEHGYVQQCIYGYDAVPEYLMQLGFALPA